MKILSSKNISFLTALLLATIFFLFSIFSLVFNQDNYWRYLTVSVLFVFILSYWIIVFSFKKILLNKITPIYKIIQQVSTSGINEKNPLIEKDIIEETSEDVSNWAKLKTKEIDNLKRLEKYRREFLGDVSHELKTPIFNVHGYVSTLLDGGLEDENVNRKYLERADKSINRLISIVEDLESISKLESGGLEIKKENFQLFQLINEVAEMHEMRAFQKQIKIHLIPPEIPFVVNADRTRIQDVLNNLIVNSIIYGKVNGKTTVQIYDMGQSVLIEVTDDGIGIEEKYLSRLFERFFRVDKSRSSELGGTGLGLAIVKHILEVHGQSIHVKSKLGEGSSFSFTLNKSSVSK